MSDKPNIPGGIVHTYQRYDPQRFPPPTQPGGSDITNAAMDHMMMFGDKRKLTEEQLRNAIKLDPSQIAGLGPSLDALIRMLEERKKKILETYETSEARTEAWNRYADASTQLDPPKQLRNDVDAALRRGQIYELERLWYALERRDKRAAGQLMGVINTLSDRYEIDELDARWHFIGREPMTVELALEIKQELETIEKLIKQLEEALENAQIAVIDLDELQQFVDEADVNQLRDFEKQIAEHIKKQAEAQGLEQDSEGGFRLTPKAQRLFQSKLLDEIFSELDAARSGRHTNPVIGEGVVELPTTRRYEFGDAASHIDLPQTLINAAARHAEGGEARRVRIKPEDIDVHLTRNTPKCATALLLDMSGSMAQMGQYVQCKRMAMAMDGLIRREYPGDILHTFEVATFARPVRPGDIINLMPKPVTIRDPLVRLRADMSDPDISESMIHPHFTNIQHALNLARRRLANADTTNKQIILFTDGLPTAHFENDPSAGDHGGFLYMLYPPDPLTERATMREAMACKREGITINLFLLPSWSQDEDDIAFAYRIAEQTGGRVLFAAGEDLDRFVLWDYVAQRRKIIS